MEHHDHRALDIEFFVDEHLGYLLGLARLLTNTESDAEDLVQETMVAVVARWRRVRQARNTRAYARRMMINTQISRARKPRLVTLDLPIDDSRLPAGDGGVQSATDRSFLNQALANLPATQRAALVLHFYIGLTAEEIGHELDLKPSSVRSSLSRGLEHLRSQGLAHPTGATP